MPRQVIDSKRVHVQQRPYVLTFVDTGQSYRLTSDEAERLVQSEVILYASRNLVKFERHNSTGVGSILRAATVGGGPAFIVERGGVSLDTRTQP